MKVKKSATEAYAVLAVVLLAVIAVFALGLWQSLGKGPETGTAPQGKIPLTGTVGFGWRLSGEADCSGVCKIRHPRVSDVTKTDVETVRVPSSGTATGRYDSGCSYSSIEKCTKDLPKASGWAIPDCREKLKQLCNQELSKWLTNNLPKYSPADRERVSKESYAYVPADMPSVLQAGEGVTRILKPQLSTCERCLIASK